MWRGVGIIIRTEMQKIHWMESKRHNPKKQSAPYRDITKPLSEFQYSRFIIIMFRKCLDLWYHYNIEKADKIDSPHWSRIEIGVNLLQKPTFRNSLSMYENFTENIDKWEIIVYILIIRYLEY